MFLNFLVHFRINYEFLKFPSIWKLDNLEPKIVKKCQIGHFGTFQKNPKKLDLSTLFRIFCFISELIMNFWNSHQFEKSLKLSKNAKNSNFGKLTKTPRNSTFLLFWPILGLCHASSTWPQPVSRIKIVTKKGENCSRLKESSLETDRNSIEKCNLRLRMWPSEMPDTIQTREQRLHTQRPKPWWNFVDVFKDSSTFVLIYAAVVIRRSTLLSAQLVQWAAVGSWSAKFSCIFKPYLQDFWKHFPHLISAISHNLGLLKQLFFQLEKKAVFRHLSMQIHFLAQSKRAAKKQKK